MDLRTPLSSLAGFCVNWLDLVFRHPRSTPLSQPPPNLSPKRRTARNYRAILRHTAWYASDPKGIRTPVTAVKGRCPGPLDDGASVKSRHIRPGTSGER